MPATPYVPEPIADWDAVDALIDDLIGGGGIAARTSSNYDRDWCWSWEPHCAGLGVDPLDAPLSAFEAFLERRRSDGRKYLWVSHKRVLSAVRSRYRRDGRTPAFVLPENQTSWKALVRAYRRREAAEVASGSIQRTLVPALTREDLRVMLAARPPRSARNDCRRAFALLALDGGFTQAQLGRLDVTDVTLGDSAVTVVGQHFDCDHRERVTGVPWDCTACAVRAVVDDHPGSGPLLTYPGASGRSWFGGLASSIRRIPWHGRAPREHRSRSQPLIAAAADASDWDLAGLRRGLVLCVAMDRGFRWVRARAWTAVAWSAGYRMGSDLIRLPRDAALLDPAGRGVSLRLGVTKDDQANAKDEPRGFPIRGPLSAGAALVEWLCVRDAVAGPTGPLLVRAGTQGRGPTSAGGISPSEGPATAAYDLDLLCEFAGLDPVYSSYSTRRGFAQQADEDGWEPEAIQAALRHRAIDTTAGYLRRADGGRRAAEKFTAALAERDAAEAP